MVVSEPNPRSRETPLIMRSTRCGLVPQSNADQITRYHKLGVVFAEFNYARGAISKAAS